MTRFAGVVGYSSTQEQAAGVWKDVITEMHYYGSVVRDSRSLQPNQEQLNDNISVGNSISIVADAYARENITAMRYVMWNGKPWRITNVEVSRPRLVLQLGGLWNGNTAATP